MRQLLWKESHEQAWKLGFSCLVFGTLALMAYHARLVADETTAQWICYLGLILLPILASTGLIPAERAEGTLEMLQSLPLEQSRWLLVKWIVGLFLLVVPILLAGAVGAVVCGNREQPFATLLVFHVYCAATATLLFCWMTALTARLPSEARAALVAIGVLIIWEIITLGMAVPSGFSRSGFSPNNVPYQHEPYYRLLLTPMVFVFGFSDGFIKSPPLIASIAAQLLIAAGLFWVTLRQLGVNQSVE